MDAVDEQVLKQYIETSGGTKMMKASTSALSRF
jgi:hypothetical protein